jgi:hypothetical protein
MAMSGESYRIGNETCESSTSEEESHDDLVKKINNESLVLKHRTKESSASHNMACSGSSEDEKINSDDSDVSIIKKNERMQKDFVLKWGINRYKSQIHQEILEERKKKSGEKWKGYVKNDKKKKAVEEIGSNVKFGEKWKGYVKNDKKKKAVEEIGSNVKKS